MSKALDNLAAKFPNRLKRKLLSATAYAVALTALVCAGMFSLWFFGFIVASGFYFILGIHCAKLDREAMVDETGQAQKVLKKWQKSSKS